MNLLEVLNCRLGMSLDEIGHGLAERANLERDDVRQLASWLGDEKIAPPRTITRAAACWLIEIWMQQRDICDAKQLLEVDKTFTHYLRDFSMAEIIEMRNVVITGLSDKSL